MSSHATDLGLCKNINILLLDSDLERLREHSNEDEGGRMRLSTSVCKVCLVAVLCWS